MRAPETARIMGVAQTEERRRTEDSSTTSSTMGEVEKKTEDSAPPSLQCNHKEGARLAACMAGFVEQQRDPPRLSPTSANEERWRKITERDGITPTTTPGGGERRRFFSRTIAQRGGGGGGRIGARNRLVFFLLVFLMVCSSHRGGLAQRQERRQQSLRQQQQQQQDSRCFLDGGGSTETFFIKESLRVGSLLGTLRVIGEPGKDIDLSLAVRGGGGEGVVVPLEIEEGTKNLRLTSPLDKEGETGPASVNVDVLCERRLKGGGEGGVPAFSIPVDVRVTDENDNAPRFLGPFPYRLNVSELAVVGSVVFDAVRAVDADQPGSFSTVEYHVEEGKFAEYLAFRNPLEGALVLTKPLDYEEDRAFTVGIVARDQGRPPQETRTVVTVNVQDADDQNPAFYHDRYDALLPEGPTEGLKLPVQPQDVRAFDKDLGLGDPVFYSFNSATDEYRYFELNRNTGHIYIKSDIPEDEFLQPVTLVVRATQFNNKDRYAVTTLTVSRGGIYDTELRFLQRRYEVRVLENVPLNSAVATLLTNRPSDRRVRFAVDESDLPGGEFSVTEKGDVVVRKVLDFERAEAYSFGVSATDGRRNDSARVVVSVLNINDWDPRFKYPQYEFHVRSEDAVAGALVGVLQVHDGDKGDAVSLDIKGPDARIFRINKRGELFIDDLK